jgi:cytochrome oxidase Cu insertion factor (SCO1/SenC/PrrC family)
MKKLAAISLLIAMLAIALLVNARPLLADIPAPPIIGSTIADFTLPDASGAAHTLASLRGSKGTVLIFIATQCGASTSLALTPTLLSQSPT